MTVRKPIVSNGTVWYPFPERYPQDPGRRYLVRLRGWDGRETTARAVWRLGDEVNGRIITTFDRLRVTWFAEDPEP